MKEDDRFKVFLIGHVWDQKLNIFYICSKTLRVSVATKNVCCDCENMSTEEWTNNLSKAILNVAEYNTLKCLELT